MPASRDLMEGVKGLESSRAGYEEAAAYYRGVIEERFANERIRQLVQQSGRDYRFRLAAKPVNALANRVQIAAITGASEAITNRIEEIRQANDMELQEPHIHRELFVYGDAYVMTWPVEGDDIEQEDGETVDVAPDDALRSAGVELTYQSPLGCRVVYDSDAGRRPRFAIRRWLEVSPLGVKHWRAELWYADRLEQWITGDDENGLYAEHWREYAEDADGAQIPVSEHNWPLENPWSELPIKHARNGLPYGRPEHADAYGPQDMITKATVTQMMDIESHGWPERARLLDDQAILETAQDVVDWGDPADAEKAYPGVQRSGRRRGPGTEQVYAGTKSIVEFTPPDPGVLIAPIDQWVRLMSTVTDTPLWEFDPQYGGTLSGIAREKADAPMKAKEEDRKRFLAAFWREVWALTLRMVGISNPGQIDVLWKPPAVIADPEWWATAEIRMRAGVPQRQVLLEANYLPDDVDEWINEQEEGMALAQQVDLLERIGAAVQSLGSGVAIGMLTQEQAAMAVERIIGMPANHVAKPPPAPVVPGPRGERV